MTVSRCRSTVSLILNVRTEPTSPATMGTQVFTQCNFAVSRPAVAGRLKASGVPAGDKIKEWNADHEEKIRCIDG